MDVESIALPPLEVWGGVECTVNRVCDEYFDQLERNGDGAYDQRKCYEAIRHHNAKATIPPRKGAKIWQHGNSLIRATQSRRELASYPQSRA